MYKLKKIFLKLKTYFYSKGFHRLIIGLVATFLGFIIILNASADRKFELVLGQKSEYDIKAPRDIENIILTEELALKASEEVKPEINRLNEVSIDIINNVNDFFTSLIVVIKEYNQDKETVLEEDLKAYEEKIIDRIYEIFKDQKARVTKSQIEYLLNISSVQFTLFEKSFKDIISTLMKEDILSTTIGDELLKYEEIIQENSQSQEIKNIKEILLKTFVEPNSAINIEKTEEKRKEEFDRTFEQKQIIQKDEWIINKGEIVTKDIIEVIKELSLLEDHKFDYVYALGLLILVLLLVIVLYFYIKYNNPIIFSRRKELLLISIVSVIILLIGWTVSSYSVLLIPIFLGTMIIAIMLDTKLAIVMNLVLSILLLIIAKGDIRFLYISLISGTLSAFLVTNIKQRSKLAIAGVLIGLINALIIFASEIMSGTAWNMLLQEIGIVALNGLLSVILTIGLLPFLESVFNIITPIKLLELSNPNQPLIKRLLLEAPGTYHHSLMVGNLAETATESIKGNAILARVGAYYHDIGKLKRPNFFGENQMSENPHEKMTPNLSTLVITAHTNDGYEMAEKYKLPEDIKDMIRAHHGTTLVSFFYHKAQKDDTWEEHNKNDFRYSGPKPSTKESAVVMLADSVEAAVRSMIHKTEGKIEGLIRKLIKDKLEDEQLDQCDLTLKDLDTIAKAFMKVYSGYFHKREEYPDTKVNTLNINKNKLIQTISDTKKVGERMTELTVIIENLQDNVPITDDINKTIKKVIETCLSNEKIKVGIEVNVMLVNDEEIQRLNKEHRNINMVTDVLSFPLIDMFEGSIVPGVGDYDLSSDLMLLGDIVISIDTAKKQAEEYGHSFERELAFLTAHSVFHLLGYDHKVEKDEKIMRIKQGDVLEELGITRKEHIENNGEKENVKEI